jgi:hypothetical protein
MQSRDVKMVHMDHFIEELGEKSDYTQKAQHYTDDDPTVG